MGVFAFMIGVGDAAVTGLSAHQFKTMLEQQQGPDDVMVLDIRTPQEYANAHIRGAALIDYYSSDFVERLKKLDRNKVYLIYCRSGNRTGRSLAIFENLGFTQVYHLEKGLIDWVKQKYPLDRQTV